MSAPRTTAVLTVAATVAVACGPRAVPETASDTSTTSTDATTTTSTNSASLTSTSAAESSTSSESSSTTGTPPDAEMCANNFPSENCDVDWAVRNGQACNIWVDDCGPDAACRYVESFVTACVPLAPRRRGLYEPCDTYPLDDNCEKGLFCPFGGICIPQCSCDSERPHCDEPDKTCEVAGDEPANRGVCLTVCDPRDPVCPEAAAGAQCYPGPIPTCATYGVVLTLPLGAPCGPDTEACGPGLFCTKGGSQCLASTCCSPFCSLDDPNACAELGAEFACAASVHPSHDGLCYEGIGVCRSN